MAIVGTFWLRCSLSVVCFTLFELRSSKSGLILVNYMKSKEISNDIRPSTKALPKKPYSSPCLKQYGAIHLSTQGTGGFSSDGGAMTMM